MLTIDLSNQRALVTGVSSGIGRETAVMLARAGCDVAGCALEPADDVGPATFVERVTEEGQRPFYHQVDVTERQALRSFVKTAVSQLGGLDIVISNAGRNHFKGIDNSSEEIWEASIDLNLRAHWRLAQAAGPHLKRGTDPVIILITSIHGYLTRPGTFPYNVAKAGLRALVHSLALDWGPTVRAVGIAPGYVPIKPIFGKQLAYHEKITPVGRVGKPENIASLAAFLASSWSSFTSGTTILVDGGRHILLEDPIGKPDA